MSILTRITRKVEKLKEQYFPLTEFDSETLPWIDKPNPDIENFLKKNPPRFAVPYDMGEKLKDWEKNGYTVLENIIPEDLIDNFWNDFLKCFKSLKPKSNAISEMLKSDCKMSWPARFNLMVLINSVMDWSVNAFNFRYKTERLMPISCIKSLMLNSEPDMFCSIKSMAFCKNNSSVDVAVIAEGSKMLSFLNFSMSFFLERRMFFTRNTNNSALNGLVMYASAP